MMRSTNHTEITESSKDKYCDACGKLILTGEKVYLSLWWHDGEPSSFEATCMECSNKMELKK